MSQQEKAALLKGTFKRNKSREKQAFLTEGALDLVKNLDYYVVKKLRSNVERLRERVHPNWRGTLSMSDELVTDVEDDKMESLLAAFKAEEKDKDSKWKFKIGYKTIKLADGNRRVKKFKLQTTDKETFEKFISSFQNEKPVVEKHFLCLKNVKTDYVPLDISKMETKSSYEFFKLRREAEKKQNWTGLNTEVRAAIMIFGAYTRPGTLTSKIPGEKTKPKKSECCGQIHHRR